MKLQTKRLLPLVLISLILSLGYSCKKDKDPKPSILGLWTMDIGTDNNIPVQLSFFSNNFFEWIPLVPNDNHTRSSARYTFADGILTITNDRDCPDAGKYTATVQGSTLTLTLLEDYCAQRVAAIAGNWNRKNMMIDVRVQGVWSKSATIADTARNLVMYPQQNGVFEWVISKETTLYQNQLGRYAIGEDYFAVYNFLDCASIVGYYSYAILNENQLVLTVAEDNCSIRIPAIAGTWSLQQNF